MLLVMRIVRILVTLLLVGTAVAGNAPMTSPARPDRVPPGAAYRWPLAGTPTVVVPFNPPAQPWLPGHRGVDLASTPGADVFAAGAGTVAFAGTVAGVGVVSVDHAGGLRTTYEPVRPIVRRGQPVAAGTVIGVLLAGHPSCPVGIAACLHWGLRRGDTYLDPLLLLGLAPVRLLPVGPIAKPADYLERSTPGSSAASRSYSSGWL
jgi:murein DD-endopeptidase MepM/ murein hydrolase activator NlpD